MCVSVRVRIQPVTRPVSFPVRHPQILSSFPYSVFLLSPSSQTSWSPPPCPAARHHSLLLCNGDPRVLLAPGSPSGTGWRRDRGLCWGFMGLVLSVR